MHLKGFIEIEKNSSLKYEFDKSKNKLILDRKLKEPFKYPYSYGFIPNTLAKDGDELDILIISDKKIKNNKLYDISIIGCLIMEDEKGLDEKILTILEEDSDKYNDLNDIDNKILNEIFYFFNNYKKDEKNKWSKALKFVDKKEAINIYNNYLIK